MKIGRFDPSLEYKFNSKIEEPLTTNSAVEPVMVKYVAGKILTARKYILSLVFNIIKYHNSGVTDEIGKSEIKNTLKRKREHLKSLFSIQSLEIIFQELNDELDEEFKFQRIEKFTLENILDEDFLPMFSVKSISELPGRNKMISINEFEKIYPNKK